MNELLIYSMVKISKTIWTVVLQALLVVVAAGVLIMLLWEPHLEGRNAHATVFQIYFNDPFLLYVYLGSIPFFITIMRAFKTLGYIRKNKEFAREVMRLLVKVQKSALLTISFVVGAEIYILMSSSDDRAGGVMMGLTALALTAGAWAIAKIIASRITR